jgi:MinD superfamily P-loop ATPase
MLNLCSGCKLCYKICPTGAIKADSKEIGGIYSLKINKINLLLGELKPSEARSAAIVEAILDEFNNMLQNNNIDIVILDTAPGAHCDVELLINNADYVIPVTEPTRFGILDLNRILELIKLLGKDYRVIVNRSSLLGAKDEFMDKLKRENIKVLGDIPLDEDIVQSYCQGKPLMGNYNVEKTSKAYVAFDAIFLKLLDWIGN